MTQTLQNKITNLKTLANKADASSIAAKSDSSVATDSLSKAIRNKSDAEVFKKELRAALERM